MLASKVDQLNYTKVADVSSQSAAYDLLIMNAYTPTPRTKVRRLSKRAVYDKAQVHGILDEGFLCHVGFSHEDQPYVIPTLYARSGESLYVHGSGASRMLKTLAQGVDICVTVTLVDGYVLARSAFHHSMNYRSVTVLGRARLVTETSEKLAALRLITEHIVPERWDEVRAPNELEMRQTVVLAVPLEEVAAKVRIGPPADDEEDYQRAVWAGVVPIHMQLGQPLADGRVLPGVPEVQVARFAKRAKPRNEPD
jgi:nitroimidazol reductase NimA-like FMN-containing flavoprotein (pyridoxamine 5'-phosphate oxidase superfamily)